MVGMKTTDMAMIVVQVCGLKKWRQGLGIERKAMAEGQTLEMEKK